MSFANVVESAIKAHIEPNKEPLSSQVPKLSTQVKTVKNDPQSYFVVKLEWFKSLVACFDECGVRDLDLTAYILSDEGAGAVALTETDLEVAMQRLSPSAQGSLWEKLYVKRIDSKLMKILVMEADLQAEKKATMQQNHRKHPKHGHNHTEIEDEPESAQFGERRKRYLWPRAYQEERHLSAGIDYLVGTFFDEFNRDRAARVIQRAWRKFKEVKVSNYRTAHLNNRDWKAKSRFMEGWASGSSHWNFKARGVEEDELEEWVYQPPVLKRPPHKFLTRKLEWKASPRYKSSKCQHAINALTCRGCMAAMMSCPRCMSTGEVEKVLGPASTQLSSAPYKPGAEGKFEPPKPQTPIIRDYEAGVLPSGIRIKSRFTEFWLNNADDCRSCRGEDDDSDEYDDDDGPAPDVKKRPAPDVEKGPAIMESSTPLSGQSLLILKGVLTSPHETKDASILKTQHHKMFEGKQPLLVRRSNSETGYVRPSSHGPEKSSSDVLESSNLNASLNAGRKPGSQDLHATSSRGQAARSFLRTGSSACMLLRLDCSSQPNSRPGSMNGVSDSSASTPATRFNNFAINQSKPITSPVSRPLWTRRSSASSSPGYLLESPPQSFSGPAVVVQGSVSKPTTPKQFQSPRAKSGLWNVSPNSPAPHSYVPAPPPKTALEYVGEGSPLLSGRRLLQSVSMRSPSEPGHGPTSATAPVGRGFLQLHRRTMNMRPSSGISMDSDIVAGSGSELEGNQESRSHSNMEMRSGLSSSGLGAFLEVDGVPCRRHRPSAQALSWK